MHGCFYPIKDSIIFQIFYKAPLKPETWKPLSEEEGKLECTQLATQLKKDGWDKQFTNVIETSTNVLRTGLRARSPIKTWHAPLDHPRVVLLGDAAHPPVPYIGQGAMMAVEDVGVLTLLLKNFCIQSDGFDMNGMSKVVEYYERIRYPRTKMMLENSMRLGDMQMKRGSDLVTRFVNELKIKSEVLRFGTLRTMWSGSRYEYQTEVSKMLAEFKELKARL